MLNAKKGANGNRQKREIMSNIVRGMVEYFVQNMNFKFYEYHFRYHIQMMHNGLLSMQYYESLPFDTLTHKKTPV